MKPIIGITVDSHPEPDNVRTGGKLSLYWNYVQAVADAGGVPILIPPQADMAHISRLIDGWMIPGGNDIDSANWGAPNHPTVKTIEIERFESEKALMAVVPAELPILGICYGCQFINVLSGGTLHQHLPDLLGHENHQHGGLYEYQISEGSQLAEATETTQIEGKSFHHQAIDKLGAGLRVVAQDSEGIIEALESTERPWVVGVQWHPERTAQDPPTQRLFRRFIQAATEYAKGKTS